MAKLTVTQKAERTLKLLLGMRLPRVAQALTPYGFSREVALEGWRRVSVLVEHCSTDAPEPAAAVRILHDLDTFENAWFPVARAALQHNHPEIAQLLFANLRQTRGVETAVSVGTFLERLAQMARGLAPYGDEGKSARELLIQRGFTAAREAEGRDLLDRLRTQAEPRALALCPQREAAAAAAMWAWYLEWSAISRAVIKNKTLLSALGFSPHSAQPPRP